MILAPSISFGPTLQLTLTGHALVLSDQRHELHAQTFHMAPIAAIGKLPGMATTK
jgi:hypothetical protein